LRYEAALLLMLGLILYRLGRNFFWDSWLSVDLGFREVAAPVLGLDFFVPALFWLVLWCLILVWAFSSRLRRGLKSEINQLAQSWMAAAPASLFEDLESRLREVHRWCDEEQRLQASVTVLAKRLTQPTPLGRKIA
jgi:hypothetical protein